MQRLNSSIRVLKRVLAQAWLPFLLALAYAIWDYYSITANLRTVAGFIKSWGVAFFLIMWFAGQWFRTSKQIFDEDQLSSIRADVAAIKEAVAQAEPGAPRMMPEPIPDPVANALYSEARAAMDAGLGHSALLTAGVAMEHSLKRFAEANGIADAQKIPVSRLIQQLRSSIKAPVVEELRSLWMIRNAVAHARDEQFVEPQRARALLDSFGWAIRFLSEPTALP